jgi:hypothetical protein
VLLADARMTDMRVTTDCYWYGDRDQSREVVGDLRGGLRRPVHAAAETIRTHERSAGQHNTKQQDPSPLRPSP